jgi:hypothetical protein
MTMTPLERITERVNRHGVTNVTTADLSRPLFYVR